MTTIAGSNTAAKRASKDVHMAAPLLLPHNENGSGRGLVPRTRTSRGDGTFVFAGTLCNAPDASRRWRAVEMAASARPRAGAVSRSWPRPTPAKASGPALIGG